MPKITLLVIFLLCYNIANAQELKASWYSVDSLKQEGTYKTSKGVCADGSNFNDNTYTCATRLFKLGQILSITNLITNKKVVVKVTDRIGKRFAKKRIDLSQASFQKIAKLDDGLCKVRIEKIK